MKLYEVTVFVEGFCDGSTTASVATLLIIARNEDEAKELAIRDANEAFAGCEDVAIEVDFIEEVKFDQARVIGIAKEGSL